MNIVKNRFFIETIDENFCREHSLLIIINKLWPLMRLIQIIEMPSSDQAESLCLIYYLYRIDFR